MRLLLVRHGNTFDKGQTPVQVGAKTDLALTKRGIEQAEALADHFKSIGIKPKAIFSGNLQRQVRTAEVIASLLEFEGEISRSLALQEIDYGLWEGLSVKQIKASWRTEYQDWTEAGIWPVEVFAEREAKRVLEMNKFVENISTNFSSLDDVIIVSSNGVIRQFTRFISSQGSSLWEKLSKNREIDSLKVRTGSFSEIHILENICKGVSNNFFEKKSWNIVPK